jgi:hypothetical protein
VTELVRSKVRDLFGERGLVMLGAVAYIVAAVGLAVSVGEALGAPLGWLVALLAAAIPLMLRQVWKMQAAQLGAVRRVDQAMNGRAPAGPAPEPLGTVPPPVPPAY